MTWHSYLQFLLHRLHPPSSWGQAPPIWSSSSTLTPLWGMDRSFDGKYSTEPASPCGRRLMVWAHLPIRYGIWSRTQSTASVSCSPGLGRAALEHLGPLWSAGQNVQVSEMHADQDWIIFQILHKDCGIADGNTAEYWIYWNDLKT